MIKQTQLDRAAIHEAGHAVAVLHYWLPLRSVFIRSDGTGRTARSRSRSRSSSASCWRLRNRRFFSLVELNTAIRDCVTAINAKIMRRIGKSRNELLETIDRPALNALPTTPYRCRRS